MILGTPKQCITCGKPLPSSREGTCDDVCAGIVSSTIGWDTRFMELADHVAQWSKDPSTKVGAVIVDAQRRIVGLGYNGFPRGVSDNPDRYDHKPTKYKMVVHSEANAILNANQSVKDCLLYATKFPCTECTKLIIQSGIHRVTAPAPKEGEVWTEDAQFSNIMMLEAGLTVSLYAIKPVPREQRECPGNRCSGDDPNCPNAFAHSSEEDREKIKASRCPHGFGEIDGYQACETCFPAF